MYEVVFTQRAGRDFKSVDREMQNRITTRLNEYSKEPLKYARKLINPKIGTYRFRIGDYRVVFDIEGSDLVILRVGHRSEIYK